MLWVCFMTKNENHIRQAWAKWDIWSKFATDLWSQALEILIWNFQGMCRAIRLRLSGGLHNFFISGSVQGYPFMLAIATSLQPPFFERLAVDRYSLPRGGQQIKFWKYRSETGGELKNVFLSLLWKVTGFSFQIHPKINLNFFSLLNSILIHIKVRGELGAKFNFIMPSLKFVEFFFL